ncbi:MAG: hypothetical protein R3175_14300 [Marinobacter sp.]|uniref:hypothetical protein n=1 Tax=Marinobacter sp. TaxID=50741 RepID=UPI00299D92D3|nr:hypothetical protein [Marinobacter sp.]MDX1757224.1 hypothetical protein [Marinobacter sp.]
MMDRHREAAANSIALWWVALAAALIPLVTTHTTYLVSALEGHVSWCIPYWDSCTSISRTGRQGTSYFIFKGAMIPAAVAGALFWLLNGRWLRQLGAQGASVAWLTWLGFGACVGLVIYTLVLGHIGETYFAIRRVGVILYFSLTYIAQLLISSRLRSIAHWYPQGQRLLWLCELTLAIGILSVILQGVVPALYDDIENAFEWTFALLINLHALWVAVLWRRSDFRARLWLVSRP